MDANTTQAALTALDNQNKILRKTVIDAMTLVNTAPFLTFDPKEAAARGEVHVIRYMYEIEEWMKKLNRMHKKLTIIAPDLIDELIDKNLLAEGAQQPAEGEF